MGECEYCGWLFGHELNCPCNVPDIIYCWKRGFIDAAAGRPSRAPRIRRPRRREAYELGYREGARAEKRESIRPMLSFWERFRPM